MRGTGSQPGQGCPLVSCWERLSCGCLRQERVKKKSAFIFLRRVDSSIFGGARLRSWVRASVQICVNASLQVSVNSCVFMVCSYVYVVFECVQCVYVLCSCVCGHDACEHAVPTSQWEEAEATLAAAGIVSVPWSSPCCVLFVLIPWLLRRKNFPPSRAVGNSSPQRTIGRLQLNLPCVC